MFTQRSEGATPGDIVRAAKLLPAAPRVLPKIKRLLTDCNSPIDEIVTLIRMDPAIAAQVVRVGNSVYYGCGPSCATVEEAVGRVGFAQVYELVSYAVASQVLIRPLAVYRLEAEEVWRRSIACALSAESLAGYMGNDASTAYMTGLLHAIGMVAIDEWALRTRQTLDLAPDHSLQNLGEIEQAILGFTQAEVGATLLAHWGFPATLCAAIRAQELPPLGDAGRGAALLHIARFISGSAIDPENPPPAPADAVLGALSLAPNCIPEIVDEVRRRLEAVQPLLELGMLSSIPPPSDKLRHPAGGFLY